MLKGDISKKIVLFFIVLTMLSVTVLAASITIEHPNGGEEFNQEVIEINWTGDHSPLVTAAVRIFYDTDNIKTNGRTEIAQELPVNGSYNWSVLGVPNGTYYISGDIITSDFQLITDYSDGSFDRLFFNKSYTGNTYEVKVENTIAPEVIIVLPNASSIVRSQYPIKFFLDRNDDFYRATIHYINVNNVSTYVDSFLFSDSTYCNRNATQINCTYIWDSSALNGYYKLNVSITDGNIINDTLSEIFKVSNGPELNITYPNNGETLDYTQFYINWTATDPLNYDLDYINIYLDPDLNLNNDNHIPIVEQTVNNGSYLWDVPISFPDGQYYILINASANGTDSQGNYINVTSYDFSDQKITLDNARNFSYTSNTYEIQVGKNTKPNINITYPTSSEVFSDLITIQFNISDNESDLLTLNIYWSHSISELGTLLESGTNYLEFCNDPDLDTVTQNDCEYTINCSGLNIEDNFIHIFVNDSSVINNKSTVNFSIDNVPILSNITISNETTSSAIVNWNINELANGTVYVTEKIPYYPIIETQIDFDFENSTPGQCPNGWTCENDSTTASSINGFGCNIASNIQGFNYAKVGCNETIGTMTSDAFFLPEGISKIKFLMAGGADAGSGLYVSIGTTDSTLGTQTNPGTSCLNILNGDSSKTSGVYWIDSDDEGGEDAFEVYCDMTTAGGGWTLVHSSNSINGNNVEQGITTASSNMATLTPSSMMTGVYTGFDNVSNLRFACDENRNGNNNVDFYYNVSDEANTIYNMFKNAGSDSAFLGRSQFANFQQKSYFDIISNTSGTTDPSGNDLRWEDGDSDTGDFLVGTNDGSSGDGHCYYRTGQFVGNCYGSYDGNGNMCQRLSPASGGYSPAKSGYWYVWIREESDTNILCSAENGTDTDTFYTMTCDNLENYGNTSVQIQLKNTENSSWGKLYIDNITFINTSGAIVESYQRNYTIPYEIYKNSSYRLNHSILLHSLGGNREYKYYVESYDNDVGPNKTTSAIGYFTLFNNPPDITVIYPNNGEIMNTRYVNILWNASDIDEDEVATVDIYYDNDNNKINGRTTITLDEINDGLYTWDLFGLPNGQYYISIDASSYDLINNNTVTVTDYTDQKFTRQDLLLNYTSNTYEVQVDKNAKPNVSLIKPILNEIVNKTLYSITFNANDSDSDPIYADVYYSSEDNPGDKDVVIIEGFDILDESLCNVTGDIYNTSLPHLCSYSWNTSDISDSNYSMIVEVSDSVYRGNDSITKFILNLGPDPFTINITDISQTFVRAIWETNKKTNSTIVYGVNYTYSEIAIDNNYETNHSVNLTNVIPNKKYHAYATSCDKLNYCETSPAVEFITPAEDPSNASQFNVTVLYPNSGETIKHYDFVNWSAVDLGGNNIKINIYYDDDTAALNGKTLLASGLENDGSEWIDFRGISSGSHYILVEAYKTNISNNNTIYYRDYSDVSFFKFSSQLNYTSNTYEVQIDTNEYPNVSIQRPEENSTYSTDTPVHFNVSDPNGDDLVIIDIGYYGDTYKKIVTVNNPSESVRYNNYPVRVFFDTKTLIDEYKLDQYGQKLAIMNSTGEVPYYIREGTFNTNQTEIWFETNLDYGESKEFEFRYGPSNRLHLPYQEPNWSHFSFENNLLVGKDVLAVTEDLPNYPATNSNDENNNTLWRGTNAAVGIPGHDNSIEWIKYDLNGSYYVSKISYALTGSGIGETFSTYSIDDSTFINIVNDTYTNGQTSATHYFLPTNMSYFYVDIRSLIVNPEFYEVWLQEPKLLDYTISNESRVEGGLLSNEILATQICDDTDFTTITSNNCSYNFESANLDGYYYICINVSDYLLYTLECSENFTIQNYEEYPILVKDVEDQKFVNIFNRKYNLNQHFNDPDNQHMTYKPQFYLRELLCHFENDTCLDLNNSIVNTTDSQNVSFTSGVFNNASFFNETYLIYPLNKVNTEGSIEMWVNASDILTEQTLIEIYENSTNNTLFDIYINNSKIYFKIQNTTYREEISYNISSDEFFHFAGTYYLNETINNISMYIDSVLVNESSISNYTLVNDYNVVLGNSLSSSKHFEGLIDEFRISNDVTSFVYNLNYSYINEYPPIMFDINQTTGRMTVYSSNSFRGLWKTKFIATDTTNRSALSNIVEFVIYLPANYSTYENGTTLFNEIDDIKNVSNATLRNDYGKIEWDDNIDAEGLNFDIIVNISENFVRVNSSAASTLNGSATIYLYNLSINRVPDILVDYNDDGNFVICPSSRCTLISFNLTSGDLIFNVTAFTSYIAQDNYAPSLDIPDFDYITNNTPSQIDLWNYTTDNEQNLSNMTYIIINQSNANLTNCTIYNVHYINCTKPNENDTGVNLIWVEVNDTELTDVDNFTITFDYDLERYTYVRSRISTDSNVSVIMKVQYYNISSLWDDVETIYYGEFNLSANEIIDMSSYWNSNKWNTSNALSPNGLYRAYIAALDVNNNTIVNSDGSLVEDSYNFTVYDTINPVVHLIGPANNLTSKEQVINFTCSIEDAWISNITLELWNASNVSVLTNTTSLTGTSNSTSWNISVPYDGIWYWNCLGKDENDNFAYSVEGNYTFEYILDSIAPQISLIKPKPNQTVNGTNIQYLFNSTDNNATSLNCSVYIDGSFNKTIIGIGVLGFTETMTRGIHNWSVNCTDSYDNTNGTSVNVFAVGCGINETLCIDGTCSNNCDVTDGGNKSCINFNGICEFGEGCTCDDCINQSTMCDINNICNENGEFCIPLPNCGNDILEQGEECDTSNFGGLSCISYDFDEGGLICNPTCLINTSRCENYNDGNIDDEIECTSKGDCDDNDPCTVDSCTLEHCYNVALNCGTNFECIGGVCLPVFINETEEEEEEEEEEKEKLSPLRTQGKTVACINETDIIDLGYNVVKDIIIEEGRVLVVNPLGLSCNKGHQDLTFNIPDLYEDYIVYICSNGICKELMYEKASSIKCQNDIVDKYKRESEVYVPEITSFDLELALREVVVNADDLDVRLLEEVIEEPKNEFVRIIQTPVVVKPYDKFNITLRYPESDSIDEGSIGIFEFDNYEWKYYDSFVDDVNNTVRAEIDSDEEVILAVIGSICDDCTNSSLKRVYSANSKNALVMVHGFGGNAGSFQPLINDFSLTGEEIDLWTFAYPSNKNLNELSSEFNELMKVNMVQYDNIVIAGHSLGGLVIQDALNISCEDYVNNINSIVLMGSPNKGISLVDKFIGLIDYTINLRGGNNLFNINSKALRDIEKEREYPRLPNVDYYVIAGTEPYKFEFGGLKFYSDQLLGIGTENDGLVTVDSARDIGGEENMELCKDYWEIDVTHSDLEEFETSRKLIKNIVHKNLETGGLGDVSYLDVSVEKCSYGDFIYVTASVRDDYDEDDPIGCEVEKKSGGVSFFERIFKYIAWVLVLLSGIVVLIVISLTIYGIGKAVKLPKLETKRKVVEEVKQERKTIEKSKPKRNVRPKVDKNDIEGRLKKLGRNIDDIEEGIEKIK